MNLERWSTRTPLPTEFEVRWSEWAQAAPLTNFSIRLDHARWDASCGRHATLVMAEASGRRLILVMREVDGEFHCGWPWRWQAAMCDEGAGRGPGPSETEARLMFEAAQEAAHGIRLRMHLPVDPGSRYPGFRTGVTIIQRIDVSDQELLESMDSNKRRLHRRAIREGFLVRLGDRPEDHRIYGELDRGAMQLRGDVPPEPVDDPGPGIGWREWEHPWMRLLVAEREGRVEACVGDGIAPGAMVDGRSAVTSLEARKAGVMALLCLEEARLHRDDAHRWLNHGGDTTFKREVSGRLGTRLVMYGWLGGGRRHALANHSEALLWRTRPTIASWVRAVGRSLPRLAERSTPSVPSIPAAAEPASLTRASKPEAASPMTSPAGVGGAAAAVRTWSTDQPVDASFMRAWQRRLDTSGRAHFSLRPEWLHAEAEQGRICRAILIDEPDLNAAIVLRREREGWVCGRPWRSQILFEDASDSAPGMEALGLLRVLGHMSGQVAPQPLELFVPCVPNGPRGRAAGRTLMRSLRDDDETFFSSLSEETRVDIQRTLDEGWEVRLASSPGEWEAFRTLQVEAADRRAGDRPAGVPHPIAPDVAWLPQESAWQWLFVALKDGALQGGSGFGWAPGGFADYMTRAYSEDARRAGVNTLLTWTAMQHAREAGCRWINWCGATRFDRQFGGDQVEFDRIQMGGPGWSATEQIGSAAQNTMQAMTEWFKGARKGKQS